jgi:hypothetical protein
MQKAITVILVLAATAVSLSAQCFLDRHNTTWYDGWISCTTSMNPNAARGDSHWILYNLNEPYELFQLHIWNTNAPDYLADGMQNIVIDISNDGMNWTEVGEFQLPMADGTSTYEGLDLYDFDGASAQYVLITGLTNHGGSCFGLSEIRIDVADAIVVSNKEPADSPCLSATIYPNPVNANSRAIISNICSTAPIAYAIQDISGRMIQSGEIMPTSDKAQLNLQELPMVAGSYILSLEQEGLVRRVKMMKVE